MHRPHAEALGIGRQQEFQQIEIAENAAEISVIILYRHAADLRIQHAAVSGEESVRNRHLDDVPVADHAHIGADVGDETRHFEAGALQHPLGALGNLTATRGYGFRFLAYRPQQCCVSDCRADGIRIRILVADDVEGGL